MRLEKARRDEFRKLAKELGYRSRAAFKLLQADKKYHIFGKGQAVLDLGSAPGGWLQVASQAVGKNGLVVGVDIKKFEDVSSNVIILQKDVYDVNLVPELLKISSVGYDVVLSDLAPNTSGIWELDHNRQVGMSERVLEICSSVLKKRGSLFMKVFEGERFNYIFELAKSNFISVSITKPKASRKESSEVYIYCRGYKFGLDASLTA